MELAATSSRIPRPMTAPRSPPRAGSQSPRTPVQVSSSWSKRLNHGRSRTAVSSPSGRTVSSSASTPLLMYDVPCGPILHFWNGQVCLSSHTFTPAEVPNLLAGWEIGLHEQGDYITLTLWRIRAYLKPYKESRTFDDVENALTYSGGNYGTAYLPVGYTQEDLEEALQELVWK